MSGDAQCCVIGESLATALEVANADLPFEFLIVALNAPAQPTAPLAHKQGISQSVQVSGM